MNLYLLIHFVKTNKLSHHRISQNEIKSNIAQHPSDKKYIYNDKSQKFK